MDNLDETKVNGLHLTPMSQCIQIRPNVSQSIPLNHRTLSKAEIQVQHVVHFRLVELAD